ncbi:hypothetical protein J2Y38_004586 [Flavobacterium sp. 2755]|jgi:hypothetical protein|uniref:hypothetical protein n=1 Tax=Flavobacterium sp. 2755 TaxID=2817765 RepID=UPI002866021F|nr:hypothetical protein [Flavobacterium sp. 2755]MDR6764353.1 hypothetical protein [Flavobacterium sp. 2755]
MDHIKQQFEKDFRGWLENKYRVSDEQDQIKKLNDIEKAADGFVDRYILESELIAGDLSLSVQHILDEFIKSKIS